MNRETLKKKNGIADSRSIRAIMQVKSAKWLGYGRSKLKEEDIVNITVKRMYQMKKNFSAAAEDNFGLSCYKSNSQKDCSGKRGLWV